MPALPLCWPRYTHDMCLKHFDEGILSVAFGMAFLPFFSTRFTCFNGTKVQIKSGYSESVRLLDMYRTRDSSMILEDRIIGNTGY